MARHDESRHQGGQTGSGSRDSERNPAGPVWNHEPGYGQGGQGYGGPAGYDADHAGRGQPGGRDEGQRQFDADYHQWRAEQMRSLDDDYRSWRQERYQKFSDEFSSWRRNRPGQGSSSSTGNDHPSSADKSKK